MIIEWNHHLFSSDTARYPWHPRATYIPSETHADPLAHYLRTMDERGVARAVIVQPEPYGDDHALVLDALAREPERLRATALFYPKDSDAPRKLEELVKREPRIVAVRFHAHRGKEMYLDRFSDAGVNALWEKAAELGLVVELHIGPNYAAQTRDLIAAFPETPVLIDHLGEPAYGTIPEYAEVLALADFPNAIMKLSGLDHIAGDAPLYLSVQRFVRQVANTFGPARLAWGGGSPAWVYAHLPDWPAADIAQVLGGNLARLLRWSEAL
ncbi:MAG: amidohydrolase family protein [Anaerolineae bacterium]|nr:amidohydrolase family protein [Candidatus Roseilinea sp.]MDW8448659.1 amidohydrolase family protein [Anaerolineae bacterium]